MERLKLNRLLNQKQIEGGWHHFPFFNEMREALECSRVNANESLFRHNELCENYPKYFSGDTKYLCKERANENAENRQKTLEMLDDIRKRILEITEGSSNLQYSLSSSIEEIECFCEDSSSLSVRLKEVILLHLKDQIQKDVITNLILDLQNIYRSLLTADARRDIVDYLNHLMVAQSDVLACLEFGAYCARTYLIGYSSLQTVSEGIQELTDKHGHSPM